MKKLVSILAVLLTAGTVVCWGQATVVINNRVIGVVDAPVTRPDGSGPGESGQAQLVVVNKDGSAKPIGPVTPFRTTPAAAKFYVKATQTTLTGFKHKEAVTLRLRAWEGKSWETATLRGESNSITLTNDAGVLNLSGMKAFKLAPPAK